MNQPIVVVAEDGTLADVAVQGPKGLLKGSYNPERNTWTSKASTLDFNTGTRSGDRDQRRGEPDDRRTHHQDREPQTLVGISSGQCRR